MPKTSPPAEARPTSALNLAPELATPPPIYVLTGMSGAGKSSALRVFEDLGYFCVDNFPPQLMEQFLAEFTHLWGRIPGFALGIDIRAREFFEDALRTVQRLTSAGHSIRIIFLDASDDVLVRRYKETRRPHPLEPERPFSSGPELGLVQAITKERDLLDGLRDQAFVTLETSEKTTSDLRSAIRALIQTEGQAAPFTVGITSFGFKHGIPTGADLVFDVRFLPNPHYEESLCALTGEDPAVRAFVLHDPNATIYLGKIIDLCIFLIPQFIGENRFWMEIAIGCTGGRHRAPTIARQLQAALQAAGQRVVLFDRDMTREDARYGVAPRPTSGAV